MAKIFAFDPHDAQHRAAVAQRAAAKAALEAEREEQRRLAGERAAAERREFEAWFEREMKAEIAAKREQRVASAASKPPAEPLVIAPYPDRLMFLSLFDGDEEVFVIRSTPRKIKALADLFEKSVRDARETYKDRRCPSDEDSAHGIMRAYDKTQSRLVRAAAAWLVYFTPATRASLYDPATHGVGWRIEGARTAFIEHRPGAGGGDAAAL